VYILIHAQLADDEDERFRVCFLYLLYFFADFNCF